MGEPLAQPSSCAVSSTSSSLGLRELRFVFMNNLLLSLAAPQFLRPVRRFQRMRFGLGARQNLRELGPSRRMAFLFVGKPQGLNGEQNA